jgi:SagB-type dehydrogenase family enzyme
VNRAAKIMLVLAFMALLAATACLSCGGETDTGNGASATNPAVSADIGTIVLPSPRTEGPASLEETIKGRRSMREFSSEPLSLEEVGQLLWAAQGITSSKGARAAPSAGGTYPLEIYLAAGNVTGLEPGIYHYRPVGHELATVMAGDVRARLARASLDQASVGDAPVDVVISAVYARTTDRYGDRGTRYVHLEAGHAAQNLCLQATALGLGAVTVGAFSDEQVKEVLRLADEEEPLYVIPIGRPSTTP